MAMPEFGIKYATWASGLLAQKLKSSGLDFHDFRVTNQASKESTRDLIEIVQSRVGAIFDASDRLPKLSLYPDGTELRVVPIGHGLFLEYTPSKSVEQVLGREYQTTTEAIIANDASFIGDPSPEARTIVSRTSFSSPREPLPQGAFNPIDRVLLMGYRQTGYLGVHRLEVTRFDNGKEVVGLFRLRVINYWEKPTLGTPSYVQNYLVGSLGLERMNVDAKDFFIMYTQIAEEQARIKNLRLRQELNELRRSQLPLL